MIVLTWLIGILTGIGSLALYQNIKAGKLSVKAYQWVIIAIWYLSGLFVLGFIGTSLAEGEPQAAGMATLIFGGLFLIFSILVYRFVFYKPVPGTSKNTPKEAV
ncbi:MULTISPECIES: hypothetical protein [Desulfitobacterium]|uniref:Dehalogenase n=2 Tax=Desulfitobacterium TaxID=36853 RepID=I4A3K3_DESDJ|nr:MULTISPECIES: hypothetical protein [Desulfitobacterium]AFL98537.1 hypothetical protein Desde_0042 [Desulfitobacterium dehalogenans ATCC 51507]BAE45339.1 putative membrane bound protein [Desulfitobacterium sp. KBC1]